MSHPELSLNTANFAKSVAMLGSAEDNTALSRALSQLAEVEDKMEQLHQDQAANDTFNFSELIADYIRLLGAVRVLRRSCRAHFLYIKTDSLSLSYSFSNSVMSTKKSAIVHSEAKHPRRNLADVADLSYIKV